MASLAGLSASAQGGLLSSVVFDDSLSSNGSTLGSASQSYSNTATPTSTSTNYDVASSKTATASNLSSGSPLELEMVSSSSGINEAQAVFTNKPVLLVNNGDSVEATVTFKNTAGLNLNSSSAVYLGLYSSGGSAPYNNLEDGSATAISDSGETGLVNTNINDNGGGVQGYVGYESDYFGGSSTKIYTRPAQSTSTNNVDQALVGDGQTGGPTGTQAAYTGQNSTEADLVVGNTYTDEFSITLNAAGAYILTEALYAGGSDTGTQLGTTTTTMGVTALSAGTGFDAIAIGYRESDSVASEMDISSVEITTNTAVPEPASFTLLTLSAASLLVRRRRSK